MMCLYLKNLLNKYRTRIILSSIIIISFMIYHAYNDKYNTVRNVTNTNENCIVKSYGIDDGQKFIGVEYCGEIYKIYSDKEYDTYRNRFGETVNCNIKKIKYSNGKTVTAVNVNK